MSYAGSTLSLIRSMFSRKNEIPQPEVMQSLMWSTMYPEYGGTKAGGVGPLSEGNTMMQSALAVNTDLMTRFADFQDMGSYPECITGDSLVSTLDGVIPMKELCEKYGENKVFKVFCYDTEKHVFTVSDAHSPRKVKTTRVIKIYFDNGTILRCTPDHPILRRDCCWIHAGKLNVGDSVMVLETRMNKSGYMRLCHPENEQNFRWQDIHRVIGIARWGNENPDYDVHHINGNKLDNSWDNLEHLPGAEHWNKHLADRVAAMRDLPWTPSRHRANIDVVKSKIESEPVDFSKYERKREFKSRKYPHISLELIIETIESSYSLEEAARKLGFKSGSINYVLQRFKIDWRKYLGNNIVNHKVLKIEEGDIEDVYDLSVEKHHNFVANGIVVHNCFTALNIYADESTQFNAYDHDIVTFESSDDQVKSILEYTFNKQLRIQENIWSIARVLGKYGNTYREIVVKDGVGVVKLIGHKPQYVRRIQDEQGHLFGFIKDPTMAFKMSSETFLKRINGINDDETQQDASKIFEPWEMVHWRLDGEDGDDLYGISLLDGARWAWKRLQQMEDAMVIHKLTRATQRYVYYVDVGDVPPNEARKILNQVKQDFKKQRLVGPDGKANFKYNPMCISLDTKIPLLSGKTKTLQEIIRDYEDGVQNFVTSIDMSSGQVVDGQIEWAGVTRKNTQVMKLAFSNGSTLTCTPDHKLVTQDLEYVEAQNLTVGQGIRTFGGGSTQVIASAIKDYYIDTGCITVTKWHNFAIDAGIFIKNSVDEDIFIARRKDKRATEVEVLSGLDNQTAGDAEYFRSKLIASLGIPKSYLGYDETIGRANLGQQDAKMARAIMRVQRSLKAGLRHIAEVDFAARNIDPDAIDFEINMTIPSGALEIAQIEVEKAKTELASQYQGLNVPEEYIWKEILGFTDDEYDRLKGMTGGKKEEPGTASTGGGISVSSSPATPSDQEGPLPAPGETPPEGETPEAGAPEAKPPLEASRYRVIDKNKQIMESQHKEVVNRIITNDRAMEGRIRELKGLVHEIRQAMPRKR